MNALEQTINKEITTPLADTIRGPPCNLKLFLFVRIASQLTV